ncbi:MAG: hypothetical protein ACRD3Q_00040, partial [Terriglobales bacterium]
MRKPRLAFLSLLLVFPLLVSCGGIQGQKALDSGPGPGSGGGGGDQLTGLDDLDPSKWAICVIGACAGGGTPGGSYAPASYGFTSGETDHSCDGYSALLTETSANVQGNAYSNILATYKAGSQDDMTSFTSSSCFYLTGTINEAEFDTFQ